MSELFSPYTLTSPRGGLSLSNRIVVAPMCQYSAVNGEVSGMTTFAVGLITEPQQAEAILEAGDADIIAMARAFLYQPRWGWQAAAALGGEVQANPVYWRCLPREAQAAFGKVSLGSR